jgi:hypothetical protein
MFIINSLIKYTPISSITTTKQPPHHTTPKTKDTKAAMSPPTQHVYIPNLMGLQVLQIAQYDWEEEIMEYDSTSSTPMNTPASSAPSSPRSSVSYNIPDDAF